MRTKTTSSLLVLSCALLLAGCSPSAPEEPQEEEEITLEDKYEESTITEADVESDTVRCICSTYAIDTEYNGKEHGAIGGILPKDKAAHREDARNALATDWNIHSRDDVMPILTAEAGNGQREAYEQYAEEMKEEGLMALSEEELMESLPHNPDRYRKQAVYLAWKKYGIHGLDSWDYCRSLRLLGDCYIAGYVNLEECLGLSLPIAEALQKQYDSWEGVAESYLYGHQFWKQEPVDGESPTHDFWEAYRRLSSMKDGPYSVPYDTVLTDTWTGCGDDEKA